MAADENWNGTPPGSEAAVSRGCTCPVMDNAHGKGRLGLERDWWIAGDCPLHGARSEPDLGSSLETFPGDASGKDSPSYVDLALGARS